MKQLKNSVESYLKRIGRLKEVTMGPADERPVAEEDSQFLIQSLRLQFRSNNYLVALAIIILCLSLLTAMWLLISNRQNPQMIGLVLAGALSLVSGSIRWLHQLWREKTLIAMTLTFLNKLPPDKAADFTMLLYRNFLRQPPGLLERLLQAKTGADIPKT